MNTIDFFRLQAKNLYKDFKTQTSVFDETINGYLYEYEPKYFDIDWLVLDLTMIPIFYAWIVFICSDIVLRYPTYCESI